MKQTHTTDIFLFISHTTNVLLFKFRRNIFIGVRIIKEMPGSVASGTHCIKKRWKYSWRDKRITTIAINKIVSKEWKEIGFHSWHSVTNRADDET